MWRYRLKLAAWWVWPWLLVGLVLGLFAVGTISRINGMWLNLCVVLSVLFLCPPKPQRPRTSWTVQRLYRGVWFTTHTYKARPAALLKFRDRKYWFPEYSWRLREIAK